MSQFSLLVIYLRDGLLGHMHIVLGEYVSLICDSTITCLEKKYVYV